MTTNYYQLLDIAPNASVEDIQNAGKQKAANINAVFNALSDEEKRVAHEQTQAQANAIQTAVATLTNPQKRQAYDASLQQAPVAAAMMIEEKEPFVTIPGIIALAIAFALLYLIFIGDQYLSAIIALFI